MTGNPTWTQRLQITSYTVHVAAFAIAAGAEIVIGGLTTTTAAGIGVALAGVGFGLLVKLPFSESIWRTAFPLGASIVLYSVAITLTGGVASTFTLLPVATIFIAAAGGSLIFAVPTAIGAIVGVLAAAWITGTTDGDSRASR